MTACVAASRSTVSPLPEVTAEDLGLKPVMTVGSYIAAVKEVPAGQGVSYGLRYHTPRQPPWRWCRSATLTVCRALRRTRRCASTRARRTRRTAPCLTTRR